MDKVGEITLKKYPPKLDSLQTGDIAKVSLRIQEGAKERVQVFEGRVLKIQGKAFNRSFTVRKVSSGVGVEKTIPLASPNLSNIEIISRAKVRRARLFYLRKRQGRSARLRIREQKPTDRASK